MKSIAPHAGVCRPARQRITLRDVRHPAVKRGVEAGKLRHVRKTPNDCFNHRERLRRVRRVEMFQRVQFFQQLGRDLLRLRMLNPAVHKPMADRAQPRSEKLRQIVNNLIERVGMILCFDPTFRSSVNQQT